jgi:hypothetical protein
VKRIGKILPVVDGFYNLPNFPYGKGGSMCREVCGGKVSPGVISLTYPGPYRPLYLWGLGASRRGVPNEPAPAKGESQPPDGRPPR